jgi:hypothetical protein
MRFSSLQALVFSTGGLVAVGCVMPLPFVRLNPDAADVVWVGGRASVQKEVTGVRAVAAFDHQDGSNLALQVEIENHTTDRLEVSPHEMTFSACSGLAVATCTPSQRVIDPEQILAALGVAPQWRGVAVQRQIWSDQALRRNTLFPGQSTTGLVYMPINNQAAYVWLQVTVAGRVFPFHFAQVVTPVDTAWTPPPQEPSENR